MKQKHVAHIDEDMQKAMSTEGRHLTFTLLEQGPNKALKLEVAGWAELKSRSNEFPIIAGTIKLLGYEIPVVYSGILHNKESFQMKGTECIVIFEYSEPQKYFLGCMVDEISNVWNIVEKDSLNVAVIETKSTDALGKEQSRYSIVETD